MIKSLPDNEIKALITLIQEEEEDNAGRLKDELASIIRVNPERVESIVSHDFSANTPQFLLDLLEQTRWEALEKMFQRLISPRAGEVNLEEGLFLLSKFAYPAITLTDISAPLDALAEDMGEAVKDTSSLEKVVEIFRDVVFGKNGFSVHEPTNISPDNVYLYSVLRNRRGVPVTLACVYLLLGKRLGVPVHGVDFPGRFLVAFKARNGALLVDPSSEGVVITEKEARELVSRRGMRWSAENLRLVNSARTLARTVSNLIFIYNKLKDDKRNLYLKRYMELLQD
ncbi:MAG TPA: transglutaminase-like domain-containing protein [Elusimicrobiales bacterium]|nr:transglutaminase-like domain-containing protein [Elusimicrobiales bacterium]